jgi:GTP cyclohydrolase II
MKTPRVDIQEIADRNGISPGEVKSIIAIAKKGMVPVRKSFNVKEGGNERQYTVIRQGVGTLTTPYGLFWQFDFFVKDRWKKYSAIIMGNLSEDFIPDFKNSRKIFIRIDSGCESGHKLGDITCDCRNQLLLSMEKIAKVGEGIIITIPNQDGRGMGNPFKLTTLSLQNQLRLTTVEAASVLTNAGPIDRRTYAGAIAVLYFLCVSQKCEIGIITNNPYKLKVFEENGYRVTERLPIIVPPTQHTRRHLEAKQLYLGHKNLVTEMEE